MSRRLQRHPGDEMTPMERRRALAEGRRVDRVPAVPFMSEFKCSLSGISVREFWQDAQKMVQAELAAFERYGHDRLTLGPNSRGITEALGGRSVYPEHGVPYMEETFLNDYRQLEEMEAVDAGKAERIRVFSEAAERLSACAAEIVPIEASVGGVFTIASNLRGAERLLRDCRKHPDEVHRLLRIVADSQKSCIDEAAKYGLGIAMADPVANPALIGPKMYEKFVYPYTKELTEYALARAGKKVSLHMCGKTNSIWKYLVRYPLNELSIDNIVDLGEAVEELGGHLPIAGNVDPVEIMLNGSKEAVETAVHSCIRTGMRARKGYVLATGCDIPETTNPRQVDWFMEAARSIPQEK